MLNSVENWLLNVAIGKAVARLAVTAAAYAAAPAARALLLQAGISYSVDPAALAAGLIAAGHAAFEWFKARRAANPNSVTTQTNPALIVPPVAA